MLLSKSTARTHLWHPCTQMKDHEILSPLKIVSAKGSYLYTENGQKIIDAISSWWCKSLGHNHLRIKKALIKQIQNFEHVMLANTTNDVILKLSFKLANLTKTLKKIFYASEGSSAVEIALKMSLHARYNQEIPQRNKFVTLEKAYHGETVGALSVSDIALYSKPYNSILFDSIILKGIPYVQNMEDPLWHDCSSVWNDIEKQLNENKDQITAIIIEPIIQAAAGMLIYSKDFAQKLRSWIKQNNIHLIADEIMTGFGRTGLTFACMHANIEPDFMCLGKSLTAGWLPMSAVLTTDDIYDCFYAEYESGQSFLHSHTHSGNALAVSVALEALNIYQDENIYNKAADLQIDLRRIFYEVAYKTGRLSNIRGIGAVIAADLIGPPNQRLGFRVLEKALKRGALLRPLGNTIYWAPPLNISSEVLSELQEITYRSILEAY
ncbi:MAG: adenosylmethionine--8-amino-7-oxononanoate transaminase [Gammaproteobacteria bacterium]